MFHSIQLISFGVILGAFVAFSGTYAPRENAESLVEVVNRHRSEHGLPPVAVSTSLTQVAQAHVNDLQENRPDRGPCNLHSWSRSKSWTPCCYTERSPKDRCTWDKPREITRMRYGGDGYEIAAWLSDPIDAESALQLWKISKGHHDIILNRGIWSNVRWRAMGAAMSENYAVVWFGTEADGRE